MEAEAETEAETEAEVKAEVEAEVEVEAERDQQCYTMACPGLWLGLGSRLNLGFGLVPREHGESTCSSGGTPVSGCSLSLSSATVAEAEIVTSCHRAP